MRRLLLAACLIAVAAVLAFKLLGPSDSPAPPTNERPAESVDEGQGALEPVAGATTSTLSQPADQHENRETESSHRVIDTLGKPVPGAVVRLVELTAEDLESTSSGSEPDWDPLERRTISSRTDPGGFFAFDDNFSAVHGALLWASAPGFEANGLVLAPGEDVGLKPREIELTLSPSITVQVVNVLGEPAPNVRVQHFGIQASRSAATTDSKEGAEFDRYRALLSEERTTGPDGSVDVSVFPGEQVFVARSPTSSSLPWNGEPRNDIRLVLRDTFTVGGTLTLDADQARSGATAPVIRIRGRQGTITRTLAVTPGLSAGTWGPLTVPILPGGDYAAALQGGGVVPDHVFFDSPGVGNHAEIDFRGKLGHDLTFLAVDRTGAVILDSEVSVYWAKGKAACTVTCRADAMGNLYPRGVAAGAVWHKVSAPGFAARVSDAMVQVPRSSADAIVVQLDPAGTLRGTVLHDGAPLRDFTVWAWNREMPFDTLQKTFTDREDGSFEWEGVPLGELQVTACGFETSSSRPMKVEVTEAPGAPIVIELPDASVGFGTLVSGVTGLPLEGADVELMRLASTQNMLSRQRRMTTTASDGSFEVRGLGPESNWLLVEATGFAPEYLPIEVDPKEDGISDLGILELWPAQDLEVELVSEAPGFDPTQYLANISTGAPGQDFDAEGRVHFENVPPGETLVSIRRPEGGWTELTVQMRPGRNRLVRHDLNEGRRLHIEVDFDESYDSSAGFSAYVQYENEQGVNVTTGIALRDDGVTTLEGIAGNDVLVLLLRKGDWTIVGTARGSFDERDELRLVLPAGAHELSVHVVDSQGTPIESALVSFGQPGPPRSVLSNLTNADGWASVFVPEDAGVIRVSHEIFGTKEGLPWPGGTGDLEVTLGNEASVELLVQSDGRPVAGATARVAWLGGHPTSHPAKTNAAGRVVLDGLSSGEVHVLVEHPSFWPVQFTARAQENPDLTEVSLHGLGDLVLVLTDEDDRPVPARELDLRSVSRSETVATWIRRGRVGGTLVTDDAGEIALQGLPAGTYTWSLTGTAHGTVEVESGASSRFVLRAF